MPFSNYKGVNISKIGAFLAIDFWKVQIAQNIENYMSYSLRNLVKNTPLKFDAKRGSHTDFTNISTLIIRKGIFLVFSFLEMWSKWVLDALNLNFFLSKQDLFLFSNILLFFLVVIRNLSYFPDFWQKNISFCFQFWLMM